MPIYIDARFTRGTGLGNRLFPWARAYLMSQQRGYRMLAPQWSNFRRGPMFRDTALTGGVAIRDLIGKIWLVGNFQALGYVQGLECLVARSIGKKLSELNASSELAHQARMSVIEFAGDGQHFRDFPGFHGDLRAELLRISSSTSHECRDGREIVINVRVARDFRVARDPQEYLTQGALRTPIDWYVKALRAVRTRLGDSKMPAMVVSDGTDSELQPLLAQPRTFRYRSHRAIDDLIALSSGKFLIGAGGSSFSAWGCFLAQSPVVTIRGQSLKWFGVDKATPGEVLTFDSESMRFYAD